jgi:hypothetical protein
MEVFLVPVGPIASGRYELYCDPPDSLDADAPAGGRGLIGRMADSFRRTLTRVEAELAGERQPERPTGFWSRLNALLMRRIAELVVEQRLLWRLRKETSVEYGYPDDLGGDAALEQIRRILRGDARRRFWWLVIDGILAIVTGVVFFFIPGPNLIAYYFLFRMIGHFLAWRGAQQGLSRVEWRPRPSALLTELRASAALPARDRRHVVERVAAELKLRRFVRFFERVASHVA